MNTKAITHFLLMAAWLAAIAGGQAGSLYVVKMVFVIIVGGAAFFWLGGWIFYKFLKAIGAIY